MTKLQDLFLQMGYSEEKLSAVANLVYLTGGIDGTIKTDFSTEDVSEMLNLEMTMPQLNEQLQRNYFRRFRGNGERQQIQTEAEIQAIREKVIELFNTLGFVSEVTANSSGYDIALVFGATESGMNSRFQEMLQKTEAKEIFILAGARDLWLDDYDRDPCCAELVAAKLVEKGFDSYDINFVKKRGLEIFSSTSGDTNTKRKAVTESFQKEFEIQWPTEADAAQYIISKQDEAIKSKAKVVDAPKKADGSRPDTLDTVIELVQQYPEVVVGNKTAVVISDQPNIVAQSVPLKLLPSNIQTTIIGKGANLSKETLPEEMLSAFAGTVFKEMQLGNFLQNYRVPSSMVAEPKESALAQRSNSKSEGKF